MRREFDLEERTTKFAKAVIVLCKDLPRNVINDRLIGQVVGASGSVGANYREANDSIGNHSLIKRSNGAKKYFK